MDPIIEYAEYLTGLSEYGKELFAKLHVKVLALDDKVWLDIQECGNKKPHFVYKLEDAVNKPDRFTCIHPATVPRPSKDYCSRNTTLKMDPNNRGVRFEDKIIVHRCNRKNLKQSYVTVAVYNERTLEDAMILVEKCYKLCKEGKYSDIV